ncbi:MAG: group intron reverse transcriptase/maturase [Ignavibacteria bacterium]|nr:group intron reverse transcriptase/maturase [Ignavibacteria bacterium]
MQRKQTNLEQETLISGELETNDRYGKGRALPMQHQEARQIATTSNLLEAILSRENMLNALKKVRTNKGSAGIDNMTTDELPDYLKSKWQEIRQKITEGKYKPSPVKRVEIPKDGGGKRMLGIPTVLDRMIQQAISQKLVEVYDSEFSGHSYGFRPGRSAHQAVKQSKAYIETGYDNIIDLDIEKFFDRVNHDYLMSRIASKIADKKLLLLIRRYLQAGIMEQGIIRITEEGTPQGSPLSPILSIILLDELDKELEKRGHRFVRYADDCTIYVRTVRAAERIKESISVFLKKRLKLQLNEEKSGVRKPDEVRVLGYGFLRNRKGEWKIRISKKAKAKLKKKVKSITSRRLPVSVTERIRKINIILRGWGNYFKLTELPNDFKDIDGWIRNRLRICHWKNWKLVKTRIRELKSLGISEANAIRWGHSRKGYARVANSKILKLSLTNTYFRSLGCFELAKLQVVN